MPALPPQRPPTHPLQQSLRQSMRQPLTRALLASLLAHALVLSVHFAPAQLPLLRDRALDVVLVNSKSAHRPHNAQALAQANLDGGGDNNEAVRASTPLPPSPMAQNGNDLERTQSRLRELEQQQQRLLTEARSRATVSPSKPHPQPPDKSPTSGSELATRALAMARLEAEIDRDQRDYNQRPRKKFIGTRTEEYRFARYVEDWRLKIERVGTLNYPQAARGRLYGSLVLTVVISADGHLERVDINRSSGQTVLDDAARRIVQMAAPYAPFPPDIRRDTDQLEITRTWFFTNGDLVKTQ